MNDFRDNGIAPGAPTAPGTPQSDWLTQLSHFLGNTSQRIARTPFNIPLGNNNPYAPPMPVSADQFNQLISASNQASSPVATTGPAAVARKLAPAGYADTAQHVVEGAPRTMADVGAMMTGAGFPAALADIGAQGYTGMRDTGHGVPASAGMGALQAGTSMLFGPAEETVGAMGSQLGSKISPVAGQMLGKFLGKQAGIAGVAGAQGLMQRVGETNSPTQAVKEALTPQNIFAQVAGQAPFAALGLKGAFERPSGISADGRLTEYPHGTALDQVNQTEALNSTETDPQTRMLNQFLSGAQKTAQSSTAIPAPASAAAVDETAGSMLESPSETALSVHGKFIQDAGLVNNPETDPPKTTTSNTTSLIGQPSALSAEPDFSLINPLGADFSSRKAMSPAVILNSLLNGEIRPTNAPDNANNVQLVSTLQRAFVDQEAQDRGYVNMNKVSNAAELANLQQRNIPLTEPQQAAWSRLSPEEQQGAHVAAKVLNDPYGTLGGAASDVQTPMFKADVGAGIGSTPAAIPGARKPWGVDIGVKGNTSPEEGGVQGTAYVSTQTEPKGGLDPRQWEVDPNFGPNSFMHSVYQGAANMMEKWGRPITTVEDAAALVKDVNAFTTNINMFMDQNGFGDEVQKQMSQAEVFTPITEESLGAKFAQFRDEYLSNPDAETAARSLQWVKNQVWLNARAAKEVMEQRQNAELGKATMGAQDKDLQLEKGYQDAVGKLPQPVQDVLTQQYLKARKERPSMQAGDTNPVWSLNDFRRGVTNAVNGLQPQDLERLVTVDPKNPRAVMDTIPVLQPGQGGEQTRTNLGKVVFEPKGALAYSGSARRELSSGLVPKAAEGLTTEEEENVGQRESSVMKQLFTGTPASASDTLNSMSSSQFKRAFVSAFDEKAKSTDNSRILNNRMTRYATLVKRPVNDVVADGSGEKWLREFTRVDAEGDATQKKAWADANGFAGKPWDDIQEQMLHKDSGKQFMWKARLLGLEPKVGVDADKVRTALDQEAGSTKIAPEAPAKKDFVGWIRKDLLDRGYQPELADTIAKYASSTADQFSWLDNADFKTLTDREGVAQRFYKQMQVMGVHLPDQTLVGGKPIKNPIIALMQDDLIKRQGYAPLNTFLKITGFGHEAFHVLQSQVVDNPNFRPTNEDTQTVIDSVHSMHANAAAMSPEDRAMSAHALIDLMVPPKFSRDASGEFLPEVKGLINAVSQNPKEYSAFMFQMATAGLGSRLTEFEGPSGVPRADKITADYRDALSWFSPDTIAFMRGQFRYMGDMLGSLQKVLDDPDFRASKGLTYTTNEQRTKLNERPGDVVASQTHAQGQTTESRAEPTTVTKPATFTTPPTAGVGQRTRAVAEAALKIANTKPGAELGIKPKQVESEAPSHYSVLRKLAQIDPKVERAVTAIQQLITNLGSGNLMGDKTVDLSDVKGQKDFMAAMGATPPNSPQGPWRNPVDAAGDETPEQRKFSQNVATRFLAPLQYRAADLSRRGLPIVENARQNIDRIYSNATAIANNMRGPLIARTKLMGRYGLDPQSGYFKFFHDNMNEFDSNANQAMSKILLKQQELGGVGPQHPELQKTITDAIKGLPKEQAIYAVSALKDINDVYRTSIAAQIKAQQEHEDSFAARLVMKQNPNKYDHQNAMEIGRLVSKAASGDLAARGQLQMEVSNGSMTPQSLATLEAVGMAGWDKVQKLTRIAAARGNFASEGRFGRYMVFYKTPATGTEPGKNGSMGFNDLESARDFANARNGEGATDVRFVDKRQLSNEQFLASSADGIDQIKQLTQATFQKQLAIITQMDPQNGPAIAKSLADNLDPTKAIDNYTLTNSLRKLTAFKRQITPGREFLNPVATMEEYTATAARGIAKRSALDQHALLMEELHQNGLDSVAKDLDTQMNERLAPSSETTSKLTTIGTAAYIGGDVARSVVDSTIGFTLGIPTLIQEGAKVGQAHQYYANGFRGIARGLTNASEFNASADRGYKLENQQPNSPAVLSSNPKQDTINYYVRRMNDEGRLARAPIVDTLLQDTDRLNLEKAARTGNYEPTKPVNLALSPLYNVAKVLLRVHSWLPSFNQKISAHSALEFAYDQGLRGNALYMRANSLLDTMTAAAGKGNKPVGYAYLAGQGGVGSEFRRSAVSFMTMMQQYGLSQTFGLAHMIKDSLGATPGLSKEQRVQAGKAAAYGLMTNAALGGTLGLTGVGYLFSAINHIFHKDPEAWTREELSAFYRRFVNEDDNGGQLFADTVMNGLANRLTGLDFAGRSGVSSLFGIGNEGSMSLADMAGPAGGLVGEMVQGLSDVTAGKPWLGAKEIAPRSLKPMVEMYGNYKQYGDNRLMDVNNNLLMQPNAAQSIGYALGWAPAQLRRQRQEARLQNTAQANYQITRDAQIANYSRGLLKGNTGPIMQEAFSRQMTPGFKPADFINQVVEKAVDMETPKDPMSHGSALNAQSQEAIGSTYDNQRQTEMGRLALKQSLLLKLGMPFGIQPASPQEWQKAALVDQLRQRGMSRPDALATIEKYYAPMLGGK